MNAAPDMMATAFKMFAALGIVLGVLFIIFYFTRRISKINNSGTKEKLIRVLANKFIGVSHNSLFLPVNVSLNLEEAPRVEDPVARI